MMRSRCKVPIALRQKDRVTSKHGSPKTSGTGNDGGVLMERWRDLDGYDLLMFRLTHWFQRALHMPAAWALTRFRQMDTHVPWVHQFAYKFTMWLISRWWQEVAQHNMLRRVEDCGPAGGMCRAEHMCERHRKAFRRRFCIINQCPGHARDVDA